MISSTASVRWHRIYRFLSAVIWKEKKRKQNKQEKYQQLKFELSETLQRSQTVSPDIKDNVLVFRGRDVAVCLSSLLAVFSSLST